MSRVVLYARVSTDDGQNATSSLAGQLDMCRARAADRGYIVVAELADDGVSGKRMAWQQPPMRNRLRK